MDLNTIITLFVLPGVSYAETAVRNKDANFTGKDDKLADFLGYVRASLMAILAEKALPKVPSSLQ